MQQLMLEAPDEVTVVLRYVLLVAGEDSLEQFKKRIVKVAPRTEKTMRTMAEALESRGEVRGHASSIIAVLEARGLRVTAEQRDFILGCRDLTLLAQWLREAATASDVSALFSH